MRPLKASWGYVSNVDALKAHLAGMMMIHHLSASNAKTLHSDGTKFNAHQKV